MRLPLALSCALLATPSLAAEKTGAELYQWLCLDCHGTAAEGDIGPDIRGESRSEILNAVANGDEMQGLPVRDAEAAKLEAYLATLKD